jgi:hypothetical protein
MARSTWERAVYCRGSGCRLGLDRALAPRMAILTVEEARSQLAAPRQSAEECGVSEKPSLSWCVCARFSAVILPQADAAWHTGSSRRKGSRVDNDRGRHEKEERNGGGVHDVDRCTCQITGSGVWLCGSEPVMQTNVKQPGPAPPDPSASLPGSQGTCLFSRVWSTRRTEEGRSGALVLRDVRRI